MDFANGLYILMHSKRQRVFWGTLLVTALVSTTAYALDFQVRVISDENMLSRDPVISETGLAAWTYTDTNYASANSHVAVLSENERIDLTGELTTTMYGVAKPVVHSNQLLFIASAYKRDGDVTWTLREVENRDEGDQPELPAFYSANEEGGIQNFEPIMGEQSTTNESVVPVTGLTTNGARRHPTGESELWSWRVGDADIQRITHDQRNDFAPAFWGNTIAWQKAKGWPFGWEIMALVGDKRMQITTNFYYDMAPKVQGDQIVWYGWDGFDYEIYMYDAVKDQTIQITSNRYDDVAPMVFGGVVVWEGYAAVESDIFMWKDGQIKNISTNIDDDLYPRIWNNKVVWQGFDGDDFEIYLYDIDKGGEPIKLTSNGYDDTNPEINDDLLVWMGYYDNWDAEIFYLDLRNFAVADIKPVQLTNNEENDRDPDTAGRKIIWVSENEGATRIMLAEPK